MYSLRDLTPARFNVSVRRKALGIIWEGSAKLRRGLKSAVAGRIGLLHAPDDITKVGCRSPGSCERAQNWLEHGTEVAQILGSAMRLDYLVLGHPLSISQCDLSHRLRERG